MELRRQRHQEYVRSQTLNIWNSLIDRLESQVLFVLTTNEVDSDTFKSLNLLEEGLDQAHASLIELLEKDMTKLVFVETQYTIANQVINFIRKRDIKGDRYKISSFASQLRNTRRHSKVLN